MVRLTKGKESRFVDSNALEALNFGILLAAAQLLVSAISGTLLGVGVDGIGSLDVLVRLLPLAITVAGLVLPGMAAMKANGGQPGTYPASMPRLVHAGDDGASAG